MLFLSRPAARFQLLAAILTLSSSVAFAANSNAGRNMSRQVEALANSNRANSSKPIRPGKG